MHTSQTAHSFTKLISNFVCFDPRGECVPSSNVSILQNFLFFVFLFYKVLQLKIYKYTVAFCIECAVVPFFVLASFF